MIFTDVIKLRVVKWTQVQYNYALRKWANLEYRFPNLFDLIDPLFHKIKSLSTLLEFYVL